LYIVYVIFSDTYFIVHFSSIYYWRVASKIHYQDLCIPKPVQLNLMTSEFKKMLVLCSKLVLTVLSFIVLSFLLSFKFSFFFKFTHLNFCVLSPLWLQIWTNIWHSWINGPFKIEAFVLLNHYRWSAASQLEYIVCVETKLTFDIIIIRKNFCFSLSARFTYNQATLSNQSVLFILRLFIDALQKRFKIYKIVT